MWPALITPIYNDDGYGLCNPHIFVGKKSGTVATRSSDIHGTISEHRFSSARPAQLGSVLRLWLVEAASRRRGPLLLHASVYAGTELWSACSGHQLTPLCLPLAATSLTRPGRVFINLATLCRASKLSLEEGNIDKATAGGAANPATTAKARIIAFANATTGPDGANRNPVTLTQS
jgi:hypothetical protein